MTTVKDFFKAYQNLKSVAETIDMRVHDIAVMVNGERDAINDYYGLANIVVRHIDDAREKAIARSKLLDTEIDEDGSANYNGVSIQFVIFE